MLGTNYARIPGRKSSLFGESLLGGMGIICLVFNSLGMKVRKIGRDEGSFLSHSSKLTFSAM